MGKRNEGAGKDLADAVDGEEHIVLLTPSRRAFDGVIEIGVDLFELLLEPLDSLPNGGPDALGRRGSAEPILFGGYHVDDLTAPHYQGLEFLSLGITQRTKRRTNFI